MNREQMIERIVSRGSRPWDMLVIGGGATGAGIAVDAASRGYDVVLVEQHDFGKGTSSRSTKLAHGGVRYLEQGNISLVMEALRERGIMRRNAPHLVHNLNFIVPNYVWWEAPFYGFGLKIYSLLAGKYGFGPCRMLTREKTLERLPTIQKEGLRGGVVYSDGQFDDSRFLIALMMTAVEQGATVVNYLKVTSLLRDDEGIVEGANVEDQEAGSTALRAVNVSPALRAGEVVDSESRQNDHGSESHATASRASHELRAKVVINATGAYSDNVRRMAEPELPAMIAPSQGIHMVFDRSFLPGETAIMVPHTSDGRVMFAIPWHGHTLVGTTDTPLKQIDLEPVPMQKEIDFILDTASNYLAKKPTRDDVLSMFAGIRPLVKASGSEMNTAALSRDHTIHIDHSGLLTIAGGKWTTYRNMAEDCVDQAAMLAGLPERPCVTKQLKLHGFHEDADRFGHLSVYGADAPEIERVAQQSPELAESMHDDLPYIGAEIAWGARHEMARTVEDALSRRTRALVLNACAAVEMAPKAAAIMARELGRDESWQQKQIEQFGELALRYRL